jgi:hypothetical protein
LNVKTAFPVSASNDDDDDDDVIKWTVRLTF